MARDGPSRRKDMPAGPPPSAAGLREAALRHLARFAATEAGLVRVLDRAIRRWGTRAASEGSDPTGPEIAARSAARLVAAELVRDGVVDDGAFAGARAARLSKAGRSRRAVTAHLAAKGVGADAIATAMAGAGDEFIAALVYARRRRLGPFRRDPSAELRGKDLAALGRAGFPRDIAERALSLDETAAEEIILTMRRG